MSKGPVNPPAYWYGDLPVPFGARLLSGVYGTLSGLRRGAYRKGWFKRRHPGVPVLVVGNLTAGGAGKTPLTIALVERLRAEGWNPGVASRGYGRDDAGTAPWVDRKSDAAQGGEEALKEVGVPAGRILVEPQHGKEDELFELSQ